MKGNLLTKPIYAKILCAIANNRRRPFEIAEYIEANPEKLKNLKKNIRSKHLDHIDFSNIHSRYDFIERYDKTKYRLYYEGIIKFFLEHIFQKKSMIESMFIDKDTRRLEKGKIVKKRVISYKSKAINKSLEAYFRYSLRDAKHLLHLFESYAYGIGLCEEERKTAVMWCSEEDLDKMTKSDQKDTSEIAFIDAIFYERCEDYYVRKTFIENPLIMNVYSKYSISTPWNYAKICKTK